LANVHAAKSSAILERKFHFWTLIRIYPGREPLIDPEVSSPLALVGASDSRRHGT
jgi:hypothetical protein